MYWIITILIFTVVMFILTIISNNQVWDIEAFFGFCCTASACLLIVLLLALINKEAKFNRTIYEYENLKQVVESYKEQDYGNMIPISEAMIDMNNKIANHKSHYCSKWTNLWYSEKIGNLEPLSFNMDKKGETSDIQK